MTSLFIPLTCRTVLYELVLKKFPFHSDPYGFSYPPQVLIYMIARGTKQEVQPRDMPKRMQVRCG